MPLAATLLGDPAVLIMDEPLTFTTLDSPTQRRPDGQASARSMLVAMSIAPRRERATGQ